MLCLHIEVRLPNACSRLPREIILKLGHGSTFRTSSMRGVAVRGIVDTENQIIGALAIGALGLTSLHAMIFFRPKRLRYYSLNHSRSLLLNLWRPSFLCNPPPVISLRTSTSSSLHALPHILMYHL